MGRASSAGFFSPKSPPYGKAGLVIVIPIISAALATALLSGCYATVPPIAQGGPREFALVTAYFDDQVKQRFPVGSDEKQLRAELHRESFKIRETNDPNLGYQNTATFEDNGVCKALWTVRWNTDQEKITNTTATYSQTCL